MAMEIVDARLRAERLACVPTKSKNGRIANLLSSTILSESPLNLSHYIPSERRRDIWGMIIKRLFPSTYPKGTLTKPPGLQRAEELLSQGYGLVAVTRHFSGSDFFRLTAFLRSQSQVSHWREIYTPLAYHQYTEAAKRLLEYFYVIPWPIVTIETTKKHRNYDALGNKLRLGEGSDLYKAAAVGLLNRGGVLLLAPAGTRTLKHEPWRFIKPIEQIVNDTEDKVAFMGVGIDIEDPRVISYKDYQGYNFRTTYNIKMGDTYTKQELQQRIREQEIGIDRFMADRMAELIRPEFLGSVYMGGAGGNRTRA